MKRVHMYASKTGVLLCWIDIKEHKLSSFLASMPDTIRCEVQE